MGFFFKKDKNKKKAKNEWIIVDNPVFGKMKYVAGWWSVDSLVVTMFGKDYFVTIHADANNETESITTEQERACKCFLESKKEWIKQAEKTVVDSINLDEKYELKDVIIVGGLYFSRDGKCGLAMEISEEYLDEIDLDELDICPDNSFGVSLIPDVFIIKSSDDFDHLFMC